MCGVTYVAQECVISDWLLNDISWIVSNQNSTILTLVSAEQNVHESVFVGSYADQNPANDIAAGQPISVMEYDP